MSKSLTVLLAVGFALSIRPVSSQGLPQTRLVPVAAPVTETGFLPANVEKIWKLSKPSPHHYSGCQISCSNRSCGSGIFIKNDKNLVVAVTNHHVIEGNEGRVVEIVAWDDQRVNAKVVWWDANADVAVLINQESSCKVGVPIYSSVVPVGAEVEVISFGGPGTVSPSKDRRVFVGKNLGRQYSSPITLDAYTVSGDSGSGYCYNGALVGVNWGHYGTKQLTVQGWGAGRPCASNVDGPWLAKTLTQVCKPYCKPIIIEPEVPVTPPEICPPESGSKDDCCLSEKDMDAIAILVAEKLKLEVEGKIDLEQVENTIKDYFSQHPQTISLALMDENGKEVDRDTVPIGGTLRLQFREIKK